MISFEMMPVNTLEERIAKALRVIVQHGGHDGAHHKDWVLDQAVRALTACPTNLVEAEDCNGIDYTYFSQGESEEYKALVADACDGEDGPESYTWETGVPP